MRANYEDIHEMMISCPCEVQFLQHIQLKNLKLSIYGKIVQFILMFWENKHL